MYACMHVCMYACMHVCMFACLHVCMFACLSVCLSVCRSVCRSVCLSVGRSVRLFVRLSVRPSVCLSVCMYVRTYVCMYVCVNLNWYELGVFGCTRLAFQMNHPTILVYSSYCSSIHSTRAIRPPSHLPRSCIWMLLVLVVSTHHPQVELQPLEDDDHERNQWDLAEQIMTIRASLVVADADNKMLRLRPFCCL